ncbi:MAG: hypothetical protein JWP81_3372 [Ferruginibacter sp.]|nr:hypothetical protein [Ferruginibacter sp.]
MKLNKEWHLANVMPKNATLEQRIAWHLEHKKHCACRDIPQKLQDAMKKKGIKIL